MWERGGEVTINDPREKRNQGEGNEGEKEDEWVLGGGAISLILRSIERGGASRGEVPLQKK